VTSRPSRDLVVAANQQVTRLWWEEARSAFELFVSRVVFLEIGAGDGRAAGSRLNLAVQLQNLALTPECSLLAQRLLRKGGLPRSASTDASHIAIAAVHRMDFLVTWNCRHIANAVLIPKLASIMKSEGYVSPVLCTPPQRLGKAIL